MNRPAGCHRIVGQGGAIWPSGGPLCDQRSQMLEILGLRGEDHIDVASSTNHSVSDQRDPSDEYETDARTVEIIEDLPEATHRGVLRNAANSIAEILRAMPSASSSSGSRDASRMSR